MILDSGARKEFDTGAVRDITVGKGRCDLMPLQVVSRLFVNDPILMQFAKFEEDHNVAHLYDILSTFGAVAYENAETMFLEVAKHFEEGAVKYGEDNWRKGLPVYCYINSAIRHYLKVRRGDVDEPHDRAFVWNVMCCIWEVEFHND